MTHRNRIRRGVAKQPCVRTQCTTCNGIIAQYGVGLCSIEYAGLAAAGSLHTGCYVMLYYGTLCYIMCMFTLTFRFVMIIIIITIIIIIIIIHYMYYMYYMYVCVYIYIYIYVWIHRGVRSATTGLASSGASAPASNETRPISAPRASPTGGRGVAWRGMAHYITSNTFSILSISTISIVLYSSPPLNNTPLIIKKAWGEKLCFTINLDGGTISPLIKNDVWSNLPLILKNSGFVVDCKNIDL